MEIYKGNPIFYSLGNFIGQNEMVRQLPGESYDRFRADDQLTPTKLYKQRTQDDQKGFPSDMRYWQTMVPICRFEGDSLAEVTIHPVSLGLGESAIVAGDHGLRAGKRPMVFSIPMRRFPKDT